MDYRTETINLLYWIRNSGLIPENPGSNELFLNPFNQRLTRYRSLAGHQKRHALWCPSLEGMRQLGLDLTFEDLGGLVTVRRQGCHLIGAGPSPHEAILSLFHHMRTEGAY